MTITHLHQEDLARRWRVSGRTLEGYRSRGEGPPYLKIGGRVRYRLEDIEAYERANLHIPYVGLDHPDHDRPRNRPY